MSRSIRRGAVCGRGITQVQLAPYSYDWIDAGRRTSSVQRSRGGRALHPRRGRVGRVLSVDAPYQLTGCIAGAAISYVLDQATDAVCTRLLMKIVSTWRGPWPLVGDLVMRISGRWPSLPVQQPPRKRLRRSYRSTRARVTPPRHRAGCRNVPDERIADTFTMARSGRSIGHFCHSLAFVLGSTFVVVKDAVERMR